MTVFVESRSQNEWELERRQEKVIVVQFLLLLSVQNLSILESNKTINSDK